MEAALTAALPHLAQPSKSDVEHIAQLADILLKLRTEAIVAGAAFVRRNQDGQDRCNFALDMFDAAIEISAKLPHLIAAVRAEASAAKDAEIARLIHERNYAQRECEACAETAKDRGVEIAALRERVDELQTAMLSPIACDVTLPPATTFRKGVSFATLMAGINQRAALETSGGVK